MSEILTSKNRVQSVDQQARDVEPMLKQAGWTLSLGAIAAVIESLDTMYGPAPETNPMNHFVTSVGIRTEDRPDGSMSYLIAVQVEESLEAAKAVRDHISSLVTTPSETIVHPPGQEPWRLSLPVITVQMLGDYGQEGFFERTDQPVKGVAGVSWSQATVNFACMLQTQLQERLQSKANVTDICPATSPPVPHRRGRSTADCIYCGSALNGGPAHG